MAQRECYAKEPVSGGEDRVAYRTQQELRVQAHTLKNCSSNQEEKTQLSAYYDIDITVRFDRSTLQRKSEARFKASSSPLLKRKRRGTVILTMVSLTRRVLLVMLGDGERAMEKPAPKTQWNVRAALEA
jgi:hypothetical protein